MTRLRVEELPPCALALPSGTVVSAMRQQGDRLRDAGVILGEPLEQREPEVELHRPGRIGALERLERRRQLLAHDLSGPATGVLAALETVLEFEPLTDGTRSLLADARSGMLRLTRLLEDRASLLTHSPNLVEAPLASLVVRAVDAQSLALDPSGERLRVVIEASVEVARCDDALLSGALGILLSNAWRFRRGRDASVTVRAEQVDGWLVLAVRDEGRGMDPATLRRAGELGYTGRGSGVGIGLFCLRRALAPTGAVALSSSPEGTTATVFTPWNTSSIEDCSAK
ncbi:MAG: HAMP domain-containing histidine kinase [Sandaracinaceae bacterium]|nr:HAMP domain-containing histidine kinase [Sandaracinaceae bacterium]